MKVQVVVEIPQRVVDRVIELVQELYGVTPTNEQLEEFFKQDVDLVYEQQSYNYTLDDAVESFFYVEETPET